MLFAAQHRLDNLVLLIDLNGQQALGYTEDVLDLGRVDEKLAAFGWDAQVVPGHDQAALGSALAAATAPAGGRPQAIVARTTFGHGVSFMNSEIKWHYLPLDDEQYLQARAEILA
jgi:transketolase